MMAHNVVRAKKIMTSVFSKYYRLPRNERPGSIFFIGVLEDMLSEVGLTEVEMGQFTLFHYWA